MTWRTECSSSTNNTVSGRLGGASAIRELPTDETAHKFELSGAQDSDLRAEIFRLIVARNWTLLELRRDAQSLDAVFRDLTRGDEKLDRGGDWEDEDESDDDSDDEESDEDDSEEDDSEEESDDDESDDDSDEDDEDDEDEPSERKKK